MRSFGKTNESATQRALQLLLSCRTESRTPQWIEKEKKIFFYLFDFSYSSSPSLPLTLPIWWLHRDQLSEIVFLFVYMHFIVFVIEASLWLPYADRWSLVVSLESISFFLSSFCSITAERVRVGEQSYDFCRLISGFVFAVNAIVAFAAAATYIYSHHKRFDNIYFNGVLEPQHSHFSEYNASSIHISTET